MSLFDFYIRWISSVWITFNFNNKQLTLKAGSVLLQFSVTILSTSSSHSNGQVTNILISHCFIKFIFHYTIYILLFQFIPLIISQPCHSCFIVIISYSFYFYTFLLIIWEFHTIHPNHAQFPVFSSLSPDPCDLSPKMKKNRKKKN